MLEGADASLKMVVCTSSKACIRRVLLIRLIEGVVVSKMGG